jgi:hypothetical protein
MTRYTPDKVESIVLIPESTLDYLNERQVISYIAHREKLLKWLARVGKDPEALEGYSHATAKDYASIIDKFYRSVWDERGYTTNPTHEEADEYLQSAVLSDEDYSRSHLQNLKLTLLALFRFHEDEWDCSIKIKSKSGVSQPKDFPSKEERAKLRQGALEYGSVPAYAALDPADRDKWKRYLARKFGKPVSEVSPDDWKRANGFKYVSLINAALDAALRPVEVARAQTYGRVNFGESCAGRRELRATIQLSLARHG